MNQFLGFLLAIAAVAVVATLYGIVRYVVVTRADRADCGCATCEPEWNETGEALVTWQHDERTRTSAR